MQWHHAAAYPPPSQPHLHGSEQLVLVDDAISIDIERLKLLRNAAALARRSLR
jgi:hypothetical protein